MSVLPIVDRELRVTARRPGTYWMRFWAALAMLGLWVVLLLNGSSSMAGQMGHNLLNALGILALVFSTLAGVFSTSDCLSEERREGTLGLLFLTNLKSYDVVLGKLTAHSLHAFFGLLSVLPILGLALLIGGVTGGEFARLSLVFVATLFFSLGISMAVSAASSDAKEAIGRAFVVIVIFAAIFPAAWWLQWILVRSSALDFLLLPSPVYAYTKGFDLGYRFGSGASEYWRSLGTLFGLGLAGIILANFVLPRVWHERGESSGKIARAGRWRIFPQSPARNYLPAWWRDEPVYWLAVRDASARLTARKILWLAFPFWLGAVAMALGTPHYKEGFITAIFIAYGMHFVVKVLIAAEASRRMNQDRRSGAWELLLVTPLSVEAILDGQKKALRQHFRGSIAGLTLVNAGLMATVLLFHGKLQMDAEDRALFGEIFLGGVIALAVDFYGLTWVGMWRGLTARQHPRAVLGTLLEIMAPPLLYFFLMFFLRFSPAKFSGVAMTIGTWFALGIFVSCVRGAVAKRKLAREFRAAVLERG